MTEINNQPAATGSDNHKRHSDTPLWPLREGERLPTLFWIILSVLLLLTLVSNLIVHIHGYFDFDGLIGFYAAFGFISCLAMVVVAKILGLLLKKPENYYNADE